jgi:hypothetical protein
MHRVGSMPWMTLQVGAWWTVAMFDEFGADLNLLCASNRARQTIGGSGGEGFAVRIGGEEGSRARVVPGEAGRMSSYSPTYG